MAGRGWVQRLVIDRASRRTRKDILELLILGTAAAEAWPAPYCDCEMCTEARRRGGPNLRSHSGALIDDELKIDHGPCTADQMRRVGRSLGKVRTMVFTHEHRDHLYAQGLSDIRRPYTWTRSEAVIEAFGNEPVLARIREHSPDLSQLPLDLKPLNPLEPITTISGDTLLPLPAEHIADALMFRITRQGKTILYGHDSGLYPEATLQALGEGPPLDIALFDCTSGGQDTPNKGHMCIGGVFETVDSLRQRGAVTEHTRLIATHFSHNGGLLHEQLLERFTAHNIEVAYDGMVVRA